MFIQYFANRKRIKIKKLVARCTKYKVRGEVWFVDKIVTTEYGGMLEYSMVDKVSYNVYVINNKMSIVKKHSMISEDVFDKLIGNRKPKGDIR